MKKIIFAIFSCVLVAVITACEGPGFDRVDLPPETTATEIVSVTAPDSNTVLITFNKVMENNAGNKDNYEITSEKDGSFSRLTVTAAALSADAKQVTLTTENQTAVTFTVKIINVFSEEDSLLLDSSKNNTFEGKELNVSGTWTGIATSGSAEFFYSWDINQNQDNQAGQENVTGVITIALRDKSLLSSYEFSGTFKDGVLQFEGTKFINLADGAGWCMTKGTLNYKAVNGEERFEGNWGPHAIQGGCPEGSGGGIKLSKPTSKSTTTELDVSGKWTGVATSGTAEFFYSWDINQIKENVTGIINIAQQDKSLLSSYEIQGTFKNNVLVFEGTRFINLADGASWCMATGTLNYMNSDGKESLDGTWGPNPNVFGGCAEGLSGGVKLTKE